MKIIVGLGNPGEEYTLTRHNIGRMVLDALIKKNKFDAFESNKKYQSLATEGKIGKEKVLILEPETFMNKSGLALKLLITSKKAAENLIVVRDDLDIPLGRFKIGFNRSSGGHRGIDSIVKHIKTEAFIQVKVGISPSTPSGKLKKPTGEAVLDFIIGNFKKPELEKVKKIVKEVAGAIEILVTEGKEVAMGEFNQK
jgi:PTH1 family peptidyl-tRNA hydrolase